jgi:hypothetical protein
MTARAKESTPATTSPAPVVLFGIDSRGKPKGARFGKDHATLAMKAASQLQLRVLEGNDPKVAEIVARLPVGRVHATGRTFVPFIRRDLYDKLVAAAPNGNSHPTAPPASGSSGAPGSTSSGSPPNLPRNWQEIGIGDLVIAQDDPDEGWYEAIVVEANGDMLTLRWRDYPRERRTLRHRIQVGLVCPATNLTAGTGKSSKSAAAGKHDKPAAADHGTNPQLLPKDWQEIDINHLVLAKADGPWGSWWEAIPTEKAGDGFKLRWRDNHANVSPITRSRLELALISPDVT